MEKVVKNHTTTYRETTKGERAKAKYLSWRFVATIFGNIFAYVLTIGIAFVIIYPLLRRIGNAFKPVEEFYDTSIVYFPRNPTFEVVRQAFYKLNFKQVGIPSFLMALYVGLTQMVVALLVGYGFARFKFRGSRVLFACVILTLVVPPQTILIPLYLRFRYFDILGIFNFLGGGVIPGLKLLKYPYINLLNSYVPLWILSITGLGFKNGLYIFMMRQCFKNVPDELEESAYVDGCGTFRTFVQIILPTATAMLITVFMFSFSWQWTDNFYTNLFFTSTGPTLMPSIVKVPRSLATNFAGAASYESAIRNTCGLLIILPLIILYLFAQKYIVQGIERSGITG